MIDPEERLITRYTKIRQLLSENGYSISDFKRIPYGLQFTFNNSLLKGLIRLYSNKKGEIKVDLSQIKNENSAATIRELLGQAIPVKKEKVDESLDFGFPIIGIDESGKGDYFGPLVISAVFLDEKDAKELAKYGITDSKKSSDKKNIEFAKRIIDICRENFTIIEVPPYKYNTLYKQLKGEGKNLNSLLAWGHSKALEELLKVVRCQTVLSDRFGKPELILNRLQQRGQQVTLIQRHRAEQNIAVASASILARVRFLKRLNQLSDEYNITLPKGISPKTIEIGKQFVSLYGIAQLHRVAKIHFKITERLIHGDYL